MPLIILCQGRGTSAAAERVPWECRGARVGYRRLVAGTGASRPVQVQPNICGRGEPPPAKGALCPLGHSPAQTGSCGSRATPAPLSCARRTSVSVPTAQLFSREGTAHFLLRGPPFRLWWLEAVRPLRRSECFDSRSSGVSCPSSGPRTDRSSIQTADQSPSRAAPAKTARSSIPTAERASGPGSPSRPAFAPTDTRRLLLALLSAR
jgi:hypothetical protein